MPKYASVDVKKKLVKKVRTFPKRPGVYLMKDSRGRVVYIGKASSLRDRVMSYLVPSADLGPKQTNMIQEVRDIEFLPAQNEVDALLAEARLIKDTHPKYNVRMTDDKTYPYLEIRLDLDFPRVEVTRKPHAKGTKLYGPFVNAAGLRAALIELQKIFKFCSCKRRISAGDPRVRFTRPCILHSIGRCTAPCAGRVDRRNYGKQITLLMRIHSGKQKQLIAHLKRRMKSLAEQKRYEEAAKVRDQLRAIESLAQRGRLEEHPQPEALSLEADPAAAIEELTKVLHAPRPIRTIEAVDIANLGPRDAVGALVQFIDGRPFKPGYRRYRIRTVRGQDDVAMIGEVVRRRFRRLRDEMSVLPDLVLVDGGLGQLHAAAEAIRKTRIRRPILAGLAKKQEEVYVLGLAEKEPLRLPRTSPALKLLQAVRDEAHRFAQHYHHLLRRKASLGEKAERVTRKRKKRPSAKRKPAPLLKATSAKAKKKVPKTRKKKR
ncbi:MAG: UvrB/UvrC motif-containing protein [Planctomycetia bacterium]|nr:UvrB/UvrC motif-containing protein [Planctomycetia bacterium]